MASGEAEPLQYTTTVLRVSIHCEGCKKKVKKVLHNIEGVYRVTVDAAQHKVTVTGSVGADALIRRLHKAGKQAALWPAPAPAPAGAEAKKVEETPPATVETCKDVSDKSDKPAKEAAKEKGADKQPEAESSEKKPEKEKGCSEKKPEKEKGSDQKPEKAEAAKQKAEAKKDGEAAATKEGKGSPEPAKEAAAEDAGGEEGSGKKGKKKKNKQKDGGEVEGAAPEKPPIPAPAPAPQPVLGLDRAVGGFAYYPPQPVMSYNVAHPSASVSYYAPTPVVPMQPMPMPPPPPPAVSYGYPPYHPMMAPPPEFLYGPPGMRSSPPQESYNNMFNEENANSCSIM
ncbi:hypothetical protein ACP4OV_007477 [Aristida adscensionis]